MSGVAVPGVAVPIQAYLAVALVLFAIGAGGLAVRRSPLAMLMCIELMWGAANLALVAFARRIGDMGGQVMAFFAITVAAAEVAIGLALVVLIFRPRPRADVDDVQELKG
ncbi:MAG TPA: NADH-quinone oxidoreductase subunit NuoK [Limnochordales bacterium]